MKSTWLVAGCLLGGVTVSGCTISDHFYGSSARGSEIVFGIEQSKTTDGALQTSVGYEFLDVLNQGWSAVGLVNRDESCWAETLDDRTGKPQVAGGVATFVGGALPANGIAVVANRQDDLVLPAAGWTAGGSPLTFQANGFAMPDITPVTIYAPATDLAITSPADPAADIALTAVVGDDNDYGTRKNPTASDLTVTWAVDAETAGPRENVVASLTAIPASAPNSRGVELRCFFDRQAGSGTFPAALVSRFTKLVNNGDSLAAIKGKLQLATHRQITILADGGWTIYVVASADQRSQTFTLTPLIKN